MFNGRSWGGGEFVEARMAAIEGIIAPKNENMKLLDYLTSRTCAGGTLTEFLQKISIPQGMVCYNDAGTKGKIP